MIIRLVSLEFAWLRGGHKNNNKNNMNVPQTILALPKTIAVQVRSLAESTRLVLDKSQIMATLFYGARRPCAFEL